MKIKWLWGALASVVVGLFVAWCLVWRAETRGFEVSGRTFCCDIERVHVRLQFDPDGRCTWSTAGVGPGVAVHGTWRRIPGSDEIELNMRVDGFGDRAPTSVPVVLRAESGALEVVKDLGSTLTAGASRTPMPERYLACP